MDRCINVVVRLLSTKSMDMVELSWATRSFMEMEELDEAVVQLLEQGWVEELHGFYCLC